MCLPCEMNFGLCDITFTGIRISHRGPFSLGLYRMYFKEILKHPAALFEIVAPSRGLIILVSLVNVTQDKCNYIFTEFVVYNQGKLTKDLKEMLEKSQNLNWK